MLRIKVVDLADSSFVIAPCTLGPLRVWEETVAAMQAGTATEAAVGSATLSLIAASLRRANPGWQGDLEQLLDVAGLQTLLAEVLLLSYPARRKPQDPPESP